MTTNASNESRSAHGDYPRAETRAHQLDRNWAELIQELRVIGTGIQVLFAFLLSIAFQARFGQISPFERDVYIITVALSVLSAALLIAPVAMHRFLFRIRVKDELVAVTNVLAVLGMVTLSLCMLGAVVLISDWVAGAFAAAVLGGGAGLAFGALWFAIPLWLRRRAMAHNVTMSAANGDRLDGADMGSPPRDVKEDSMTKKPDPLDPDAHDQQSLEEAEEKMLLRHDEHDEKSDDEPSPLDSDHDPDALAEAEEKMLLREKRN